MRTLFLIAKKELGHSLNNQLAYILILTFVISLPIPIFWSNSASNIFLSGQTDLHVFFLMLPLFLMVFIPALAMGTWSGERTTGTLEVLLTWPVTERDLVLGKFLGHYILLAICLLGTLAIPICVSQLGDLDWGPVLGAYFGSLLLAAFCLSATMLVSVYLRSGVTAFIVGFLTLAGFMFIDVPLLNPHSRFVNIARGVLDSRDMAFYILATTTFLYLNTRLLTVRK